LTAPHDAAIDHVFDIVVPSAGRASLQRLLEALAAGGGPRPGALILVDDRPAPDRVGLAAGVPSGLAGRVEVLATGGRGPAAARNAGWRASRAEWVAFLDDDVVPPPGWAAALRRDLAAAPAEVAGSQGRVRVPLPAGRRPTDWERNVAGLERARWATADMAFRRAALAAVGGFDERFPRAYREDADLALRLRAAGHRLTVGERDVCHPVPRAGRWTSVRKQAGNADDVLMRALHGRDWRARAQAPAGRLGAHRVTTALLAGALGAAAARRRTAAGALGATWLAATARFAWQRIAPGPRTPDEVATMALTSALIPPTATAHWLTGHARRRRLLADAARAPRPARAPDAVLLDRDGTLVVDVPYNGDPERVRAMPGARAALDRLRAAGVRLAVVSNQSGIGRGLLTEAQVAGVNRRVEDLLGPLGPWVVCPHAPEDGCACRKPAPALVLEAAGRLGVAPERCAVVGDIGADVEAARAAGARGVLVPTPRTLRAEVAAAEERAPDLEAAVDLLLGPSHTPNGKAVRPRRCAVTPMSPPGAQP
jgi:histidinol-phosphate phosphatase family protein